MSANPKFLAATAQVDEAAVRPLPSSRKVYVGGSPPGIPGATPRDPPVGPTHRLGGRDE